MPRYRWMIVVAGGLLGCVAAGTMFALAVFLQPMADAAGWSRAGISSAMTINFLVMGPAGFFWGALSDRVGPRPVLLAGSILLGLGAVLASRASSLLAFQIIYGVLIGAGVGAIFAPIMATVTGWFDTQRSLAVSLVSAGMGMAPMTLSPFSRWLISSYDWRTSLMIVGVVAWVLMIPAALLVRRAPAHDAADAADAPAAGMTMREALRTPQFIVLALTYFCCCATHAGPIFHTVSYAIACGIAPMAAVSIYSLEGLAGLGGRLIFGLAGDRFGAKPSLVVGLVIQACAAGAYFFAGRLGDFYAIAAIFGMAYGGVMPLYAVLIRENFPMRIMGGVMGAATMVSSLGMAAGPLAGGWIYDVYGSYAWLYVGSFGIGWGAVAIALLFRPALVRASPRPATA
ncbi:MAG: MFS transporter [Rhodoblastus sp.]